MPLSIDLHVKCPFYKKWNKKKTPIFFLKKFHTVLREQIAIFYQIFKSVSSKFCFKCPKFTKVGIDRGSFFFKYLKVSECTLKPSSALSGHGRSKYDLTNIYMIYDHIPTFFGDWDMGALPCRWIASACLWCLKCNIFFFSKCLILYVMIDPAFTVGLCFEERTIRYAFFELCGFFSYMHRG